LNQYHVILETDPKFQLNPRKLHDIYIQSSLTSNSCRLRRIEYRRIVVGRRGGAALRRATRC
jgi:hypothetical protein